MGYSVFVIEIRNTEPFANWLDNLRDIRVAIRLAKDLRS